MHIFLTGERGVGKSTLVQAALAQVGERSFGFRTGFDPARTKLYLYGAQGAARFLDCERIATMQGGRLAAEPARFDALGAAALRGQGQVCVMDELGHLERDARVFQRAVCGQLDLPQPILGVMKPDWKGTWLQEIAQHPRVTLLQVTQENRAALPQQIAREIKEVLAHANGGSRPG